MKDFVPNLAFFLVIGFAMAFASYPFLLVATMALDWIAGQHLYGIAFNARLLAGSGFVWMTGYLAGN